MGITSTTNVGIIQRHKLNFKANIIIDVGVRNNEKIIINNPRKKQERNQIEIHFLKEKLENIAFAPLKNPSGKLILNHILTINKAKAKKS